MKWIMLWVETWVRMCLREQKWCQELKTNKVSLWRVSLFSFFFWVWVSAFPTIESNCVTAICSECITHGATGLRHSASAMWWVESEAGIYAVHLKATRERERFVHQRFSVFWLLALPPLSCHRRERERAREREKKRGRNMVSSDAPPVSALL